MPNATGTARTPGELLTAINTLVIANGWTKLRGETDQVAVSPKAARYWRLLWIENQQTTNDFRQLTTIQFRSTIGGSELSGTWTSKGIASGSLPGLFRTGDIDDDFWWIKLDTGSATVVRQCLVQAKTATEAPKDFIIQWSNDDLVWTTMFRATEIVWTNDETKLFNFDDGFLDIFHINSTKCLRTGFDVREETQNFSLTSGFVDYSDDRFIWQAPGYDANRRVFVHARGHINSFTSSSYIELTVSPSYNPAIVGFKNQIGGYTNSVWHFIDSTSEFDYWIYANSSRLIIITKHGVDDYVSSYIGFMGAFADPDNYPSPLILSSTSGSADPFNTVNNRLSSMADPGINAAAVRLWDNTWNLVHNRLDSGLTNLYRTDPSFFLWPYHCGSAIDEDWPFAWVGSNTVFNNHWLNQHEVTEQGDLPLYPIIVTSQEFGNIGALQGVFCVPGGTLVPEQSFIISAVNYKAFPNRNRRDGLNWFVVRED